MTGHSMTNGAASIPVRRAVPVKAEAAVVVAVIPVPSRTGIAAVAVGVTKPTCAVFGALQSLMPIAALAGGLPFVRTCRAVPIAAVARRVAMDVNATLRVTAGRGAAGFGDCG